LAKRDFDNLKESFYFKGDSFPDPFI
jgi:hypothetical protein